MATEAEIRTLLRQYRRWLAVRSFATPRLKSAAEQIATDLSQLHKVAHMPRYLADIADNVRVVEAAKRDGTLAGG